MDEAKRTVTVTGSQNVVLSAERVEGDISVFSVGSVARDLHVHNNQVVSNPQFFEPSLDDYGPDRWVNHAQARELTQLLHEHRLVFLAGDLDEKTDCARHLAYLLREIKKAEGTTLHVRERCRGKEPQRIETAFQDDEPVALLLVELTPRQLLYTVGELRRLLRARGSFAVVTTECSRAEWEGTGLDPQLWRELSWKTYYGEELLTELLLRHLASSERLPDGLLPESVDGPLLVLGLSVAATVQTLRTPARVQAFSQWLLNADDQLTAEGIEEQLAQMAGDAHAIIRWYREFEPRDQLLVLGLTLFDGLPDDLLFAGLELLVETTWRSSDPLLSQFDYQDLPRFATYFKQIDSEEGFFRIQCASRERRQQILELAWTHQRRRLLATLPALTQLTRISAADSATLDPMDPSNAATPAGRHKSTLQRSSEKRDLRLSESGTLQIQQALVESLSLVGLLSIDVVKPYFLELATDPTNSVQSLSARALSAWRDGHDVQFFSLLESWWAAGTNYESDNPLLSRLSAADPRAAVRSAVALVVGYAARFDRPNRLAPELHRLLTQLVDDRDAQVRKTMADSTLWLAVAWHFRQVEPLLRTKVLKDEVFLPAVAFGAATACSMRPEESFAILDGWRATAKADRRKSSPLLRERLLAAMALAYGYLNCDETVELLSPRAVGARLRSMLAEETNPFVRHYVFFAIELQAVRSFELVGPILQDLLSHISLVDRPAAVEVFVRTYLAQRQRLPGGERRVFIGDRSYGVWSDASQRPLTEVEAALYSWILDDSMPTGQQLAVDIFEALGETALERQEHRLPPIRVAASDAESEPEDLSQKVQVVRRLPWLGWMSVYLAAPRKSRVRAILRPLLAEVLAVQERSIAPRARVSSEEDRPIRAEKPSLRAAALLARWRAVPNESTKAIARHLQRARGVYQWRWAILLVTILALAALSRGAVLIYERLTVQAKPAAEAAPADSGLDADSSASPAPPEELP